MKEILIVGNGENIIEPEKIRAFSDIICADGGYRHVKNIKSDVLVIGDMDSIGKTKPKNAIVYPKDKDYTDTELCIKWAIKNGYTHIYITGIYGSRPDHFLASVFLLEKYRKYNIMLLTDNYDIFLIKPYIEYSFSHMTSKAVSFFSIKNKTQIIESHGFLYNLSGLTLKVHTPIGVSNKITKTDAYLYYEKGLLLCCLEN